MSQTNHQHNEPDELRDRLVEQGLREVLGGENPPDLSQQIISALTDSGAEVTIMKRNRLRKRVLGLAALAASILLLACLMLPATVYRATAHRAQSGTPNEAKRQYRVDLTQADESVLTDVRYQQNLAELDEPTGERKRLYVELGGQTQSNANTTQVDFAASKLSGPSAGDPFQELSHGQPNPAGEAISTGQISGGTTVTHKNLPTPQPSTFGEAVLSRPGSATPPEPNQVHPDMWGGDMLQNADSDDGQGSGPGDPGDQYARIHDNPFLVARGAGAVSTFSIDVDTASYANVRQFILQSNRLPPPDAVRIEELINYFDYDYAPPSDETPFASHVEVAGCPWQPEHRLVRIALKGREMPADERPLSNLVFLVDVSGSMNQQNKLPLVVDGLKYLTRELGENDRVAIVVYASAEGLALPSTPGTEQETILSTLNNLAAGGSTAGGAGIKLAYQVAEDNFIEGGVNRVILCTDGDFNVGVTSTAELERMAEEKAKGTGVFLTVLGFGRGNLNDAMMETISNKGNGNYHYVDNLREARRVLVEQMTGTLVTIAKDVKIQVEFNPAKVAGYRLIGYENRLLAREDFNDDTKDAGEIGAGHTVTAVYQVVPDGKQVDTGSNEPLKYQQEPNNLSEAAASDELLTLRVRYKPPTSDTSTKLEFPVRDSDASYANATADFKFAAAVASFGMLLRDSEHRGNATYDAVLELAEEGLGADQHGYRAEFLEIVKQAKSL